MRFPIMTTDGREFMIGGMPLVTDEKFTELYPELDAALDRYEDKTKPQLDRGKDLVLASRLVIKVFYPKVDVDSLLIDAYTLERIMDIWQGSYDENEKDKKKESANTSEDTTEQEQESDGELTQTP